MTYSFYILFVDAEGNYKKPNKQILNAHDVVIPIMVVPPTMSNEAYPIPYEYTASNIIKDFPGTSPVFIPWVFEDDHKKEVLTRALNGLITIHQINVGDRSVEQIAIDAALNKSSLTCLGTRQFDLDIVEYFKLAGERYPIAFQTVDVIMFNPRLSKVIFGYKKQTRMNCLIGGFVDPVLDLDIEGAAIREVSEETGYVANDDTTLTYLGNTRVNDRRYQKCGSKIFTHIYILSDPNLSISDLKEGDDIDVLESMTLIELKECLAGEGRNKFLPGHVGILNLFLNHINQ